MAQKRICRVAGITLKNDHVLIHRRKDDDYWTFPGGGCKFYETTKDALEREYLAEIGAKITIEKLIFIVENLYFKKNIPNHEIEFFYSIKLEDKFQPTEEYFFGKEGDETLVFYWCPIKQIENIKLYPKCLRKTLHQLPENITHIINKIEEENKR